MNEQPDDERQDLLTFLAVQRASVVGIVSELDEAGWHTSVVPSGWTPAGLVQHLGDAERHWFQSVVLGVSDELPWDEGRPPYRPDAAFVSDRPGADVLVYYREQCARSDAVIARVALTDRPLGSHGFPDLDPENVRAIVLHMIEETATHSGHLDIARELIDGRTNLGDR